MSDPHSTPTHASMGVETRSQLKSLVGSRQPSNTASRTEFADCFREMMPKVVAFVMRLGAEDQQEALDAAQGAFTAAWENWETIQHPKAWLRRVAQRKFLEIQKHRLATNAAIPEASGGKCPAESFEFGEQEVFLLDILRSLPMAQRQAFAWEYDGFSPHETASALGMSAEAVRQNLFRARKNLKRAWQKRKEGAE